MRILVVDDSRTMRRIICTTLQDLKDDSLELLEAADGIEALQLLRNEKLEIDLVLIDWNMPRLDGIGFLKQLKVISPFREVHVIMVTSQANRTNVAEALRWGASDYVVKPFVPEVLHEKIRKVAAKIEVRRCEETSVMLRSMVADASSADEQPFLDQLPGDLVEEIRSLGTMSTHPEGSILVSAGMRVDALCFVLQGAVEIANPTPPHRELRRPGDCFAEHCFLSGDPANFNVSARTLVKVQGLSRIQVADLARRRHEFGYALSRWVTRPSRTRKLQPPPSAGLVGSLETMPIADLIQVLNICRKTGLLRLSRGTDLASLYFDDGEIRHATVGDQAGEDAFFRLMAWTDAAFAFESGVRAAVASLSQPTMTL
ncbi:MAG TPA: response regulator, partial [Planctomycetota bacterium]|nr:response regulator [Planctomycetota bacterium]